MGNLSSREYHLKHDSLWNNIKLVCDKTNIKVLNKNNIHQFLQNPLFRPVLKDSLRWG
jgi:hypothetical protein